LDVVVVLATVVAAVPPVSGYRSIGGGSGVGRPSLPSVSLYAVVHCPFFSMVSSWPLRKSRNAWSPFLRPMP